MIKPASTTIKDLQTNLKPKRRSPGANYGIYYYSPLNNANNDFVITTNKFRNSVDDTKFENAKHNF